VFRQNRGGFMSPSVTFDAHMPARRQEEDFDCSQESLEWALHALGREPSDDWLESTMITEGVMSAADGLLDASGADLAAFVRRHYGEFGFDANHAPSVDFDELAAEIGPYPILIGGRAWGHWSGVRGYDPARDLLLLANPADGWKDVGQTMSRQQWADLGPFSMVRVLHPDLGAGGVGTGPEEGQAGTYRVTEAGVRLRAAPGTSHPIVLEDVGAGTVVTAVDDLEAASDGHVWRHVDVGGTVGWVAAEFLQQIDTEPNSGVIGDPTPPTDAWHFFTAEQIAEVTSCPIDAIRDAWPRLVGQFELCGINDRAVQVAAMGTIAIETASTFAPVREAFWLDEAWRRDNLTRYYPYYGRGYVQITWESNYRAYSRKINELWGAGDAIDLIARPDDAMHPDVAAAVLALYFRDHGGDGLCLIPEAARRGDWREVRRLVQGGDAKVEELIAMAGSAIAVTGAGPVTA